MLTSKHPHIKTPSFSNISSLASLLSVSESALFKIASNIEKLHKPGKLLCKKNGEPRPTHDAKEPLKTIHEHIKNRILKQVIYPQYMVGGIADPINPRNCITNANIHLRKKILIAEDIKDFFPSSNTKIVYDIWKYCFKCSPEIADILTKLTTYNKSLPQGWKTSGYIANLTFWDKEPVLVELFEKYGYSYSRFIDDITVSSKHIISEKQKSFIISNIYGMLYSKGYKPKRSKHEILSSRNTMCITGLVVNGKKPTITKKERNKVRSLVFQLEQQSKKNNVQYCKNWKSVSGMVGRICSLHKAEGGKLRERLQVIKPPKHLLNKTNKRKKCHTRNPHLRTKNTAT